MGVFEKLCELSQSNCQQFYIIKIYPKHVLIIAMFGANKKLRFLCLAKNVATRVPLSPHLWRF